MCWLKDIGIRSRQCYDLRIMGCLVLGHVLIGRMMGCLVLDHVLIGRIMGCLVFTVMRSSVRSPGTRIQKRIHWLGVLEHEYSIELIG